MAILNPDATYTWNGLKVNEYLLTRHNPNRIDMPSVTLPTTPLGVTIHNTEAISTASNTTMAEQYTRATVNGNMKDVRVHFYVDDVCAWQNLPFTLSGWHAADGSGNGNRKTIAIEVIGNSSKAEANAVKLAAYLLKKYNLNVENNLFTHTHWLNVRDGKIGSNDYLNTAYNPSKMCPIYILPHWQTFKNNVKTLLNNNTGNKPSVPSILYRIRKIWEDASSQIGAYTSLDNAKKACKSGYSVFDENGKVVYSCTSSSNDTSTSSGKIDVRYRAYTNGKWYGEITNYNTTDSNGYAGVEGAKIRGLVAKTTKGTLKYRVHVIGGGWLGWISNYDPTNWSTGCAGVKTKDIDAIQLDLQGVDGYCVKYRVSTINSSNYLSWIIGYNTTNSMGYAGVFGKSIDKIQIEIVKK